MLRNEYDADPSHSKPSCVDPVESPVRRGMSIHVPAAMTTQTAMDNALDLHRAGWHVTKRVATVFAGRRR